MFLPALTQAFICDLRPLSPLRRQQFFTELNQERFHVGATNPSDVPSIDPYPLNDEVLFAIISGPNAQKLLQRVRPQEGNIDTRPLKTAQLSYPVFVGMLQEILGQIQQAGSSQAGFKIIKTYLKTLPDRMLGWAYTHNPKIAPLLDGVETTAPNDQLKSLAKTLYPFLQEGKPTLH